MEKTNHRLIKVIITLIAIFMALTSQAQVKMTAILQHGDTPQAFYGADAFKEAMTAAQTGDVISLSTGNFNATNIDKAVRIHGAGVSTKISGNLSIAIPDEAVGLEIEGVAFPNNISVAKNLVGATIKRCRFNQFEFNNGVHNTDNKLLQCVFTNDYKPNYNSNYIRIKNLVHSGCIFQRIENIHQSDDLTFFNCVINDFINYNSHAGNIVNCIIRSNPSPQPSFNYVNTIVPNDGSYKINGESLQENVIFMTKAEIAALFKNTTDFELTDSAASSYIGNDGTQIGAHGGTYPFTLVPAIPAITSTKIDSKVKEDGKLSISITAETNN